MLGRTVGLNRLCLYMKIRSLIAALFLTPLFCSLAFALQGIKQSALFGTWRVSAQHPSGAVITATVQFTQDLKFTSSTTANDKPFMDASGTWSLKGRKLEWTYKYSSQPVVAPGFVDTDEVLSVSDTELTLLSKMSGRTQIFQRVR